MAVFTPSIVSQSADEYNPTLDVTQQGLSPVIESHSASTFLPTIIGGVKVLTPTIAAQPADKFNPTLDVEIVFAPSIASQSADEFSPGIGVAALLTPTIVSQPALGPLIPAGGGAFVTTGTGTRIGTGRGTSRILTGTGTAEGFVEGTITILEVTTFSPSISTQPTNAFIPYIYCRKGLTLLGIRKLFVNLSGRHDLVVNVDSYKNSGADFFIQAGQRYLEKRLYKPSDTDEEEFILLQGEYQIDLQDYRAVQNVWVRASDATSKLEKLSIGDSRKLYAKEPNFDNIDQGIPLYYTIEFERGSTFEGKVVKRLILLPPADTQYTVVVRGLKREPTLCADNDINWWTLQHPETLIQAAMFVMERFYRNTEGMRDHLAAIDIDIQGMNFDEVEQEIAEIDDMGSIF